MSDMSELRPGTGINWTNQDRTVGTVEYGSPKDTHAVFFMDKVHNPVKSQQAGHPIYDNVPFVRIGSPGERLNIVIRPASQTDQRRFAMQWAQFQQNVEQRPSGTPVSILFPENPAVIGLLEGSSVFTVEQLAELSANAIENIGMGCQKYVNEAQQYLKIAEKGVKATEFRHQLDERDRKIAALTQNVQELNNTVTKLLNERKGRVESDNDRAFAGAMERPTHMPRTPFDPQAEQIAATGRETRPVPQKPVKAAARRQRARLNEG